VLVSAGFDAHERDPLGGMRLTTAAFAAMTAELRVLAEEYCGGGIAIVTEGGYDLQALGESLDAVVQVLASTAVPGAWPASGPDRATRGRAAANATKEALAPFWRL
jgi:acetoin utilization deacetylase AcuC-like enzyme